MSAERADLLVLGLGNTLFGDDGLGIVAVERLRARYDWPENVQLVDGGTLGLQLLPVLEAAERAILIDAIRADAEPGTIVRLQGDAVANRLPQRLSPHEIGVADLLFGSRLLGHSPDPLVLLGIIPEKLDWGVERSEVVDEQIDDLVGFVVKEARKLGFEARPVT